MSIVKPTLRAGTLLAVQTAQKDAIALLKADREAVIQLFLQYEVSRSAPEKKALVQEICAALSVHAQIEEEIFYPEVKTVLKDPVLAPQARLESAVLKSLIAQLERDEANGARYDEKVKVLSAHVKHHVKAEHSEVFLKLKNTWLDLDELGARMAARRDDLLAKAA